MLSVFIASAFLLEIRLLVTDKKSPILTLPMAQLLVVSGLSGNESVIMKALKKLDYYLRRNYCAYKSYREEIKRVSYWLKLIHAVVLRKTGLSTRTIPPSIVTFAVYTFVHIGHTINKEC